MQQLWQNEQNFVNLSHGTKKPKLDEIFKIEFFIYLFIYRLSTDLCLIDNFSDT
jgi:hypothetical protein